MTRRNRTRIMLDELKRQGGGRLVCHPKHAERLARELDADGATVTCVLCVQFPSQLAPFEFVDELVQFAKYVTDVDEQEGKP